MVFLFFLFFGSLQINFKFSDGNFVISVFELLHPLVSPYLFVYSYYMVPYHS